LSIAEKLLKDELSNKEAQTKLVEKMLGDVKAKLILWQVQEQHCYAKAILEIAQSKGVAEAVRYEFYRSTINGNLELSTFIQNPL
jgi:hypothetical protein